MAYEMYFGKTLMPVMPEKLEFKMEGNNTTVVMMNQGEVNWLRSPKLTDISFDLLLPNHEYPFAQYLDGFKPANEYLELFEKYLTNKKPFQFIVTRTLPDGSPLWDTDMTVSLESYTPDEEADEGQDVKVSIELKLYRHFGTKKVKIKKKKIKGKTKKVKKKQKKTRKTTKNTSKKKIYTVKKGDCLWNIAKKYYGDGAKYKLIYNANKGKIKNPNKIYVGEKIIIPGE